MKKGADDIWRVSHAQAALRYRMNIGTIIESTMITVKFGYRSGTGQIRASGRKLGQIEDYFAENLVPGDTFLLAVKLSNLNHCKRTRSLSPARHNQQRQKFLFILAVDFPYQLILRNVYVKS